MPSRSAMTGTGSWAASCSRAVLRSARGSMPPGEAAVETGCVYRPAGLPSGEQPRRVRGQARGHPDWSVFGESPCEVGEWFVQVDHVASQPQPGPIVAIDDGVDGQSHDPRGVCA